MKTRFKMCLGPELRSGASLRKVLWPTTHLLAHQNAHHIFGTMWCGKRSTAATAWPGPKHYNTSSLSVYREIEKGVEKRENGEKIKNAIEGGVSERRASVGDAENGR